MHHLDESYFGMMEYEEYHLKKSKVTLFEFRADVKQQLSMILPFQLDLPEDTLPSYDQVVKKGMPIEFDQVYAQRDSILKRFGQNRSVENPINN